MLIKCPECGHQVSDKAPLCPNCGVEIAGKISRCPQCGEMYVNDGGGCPHCDIQETVDTPPSVPVVTVIPEEEEEEEVVAIPVMETDMEGSVTGEDSGSRQGNGGGKGHNTFIVPLLIAAVICGVGLYFYKDAVDKMEAEHKNTTAVADTVAASPDIDVIEDKDTVPAVQPVAEEPAGPAEEDEAMGKSKPADTDLTGEEKEKAEGSVRRFLRAINSHDKDALTSSVASFLTSFNGKRNATKYDVLQYMTDLYQADVKNLNWHIDSVSEVEKRENAEGNTEYVIVIKATKETEREGGTSRHRFNIEATVDSEWKISAVDITRE